MTRTLWRRAPRFAAIVVAALAFGICSNAQATKWSRSAPEADAPPASAAAASNAGRAPSASGAGATSVPASQPAPAVGAIQASAEAPAVAVVYPKTAVEKPATETIPDSPGASDNSAKLELVRNWFTLSIQQDLIFHSKTADACGPGSPYRCFNAAKQPWPLVPGKYAPGGNQISGSGALPGTLRILLGFDRVVHPHISLGVRVGSVVSGKALKIQGDPAFLYFHGEARLAIWLGRNVFSRAGFRPYLLFSGGFAEADGKIAVDYQVPGDANTYKLDAWKRSGHSFVSPGLGFQAAFTKKSGPVAEFRYMQFLSPNVPVLAFQLGYAVGF